MAQDKPWTDESRLRELYVNQRKSSHEIGEILGCHNKTVLRWLDRHGIETRDMRDGIKLRKLKQPASYYTTTQGYVNVASEIDGEKDVVGLHRLLAVSEYGLDEIEKSHVHHKNSIPWDNRPENIEIVDPSSHGDIHGIEKNHDVKVDAEFCAKIRRRNENEKQSVLADEFGLSQSTISLHASGDCHHD